MKRYGLLGNRSRDFLTYGGRVLTHHNAAELEFLVPVGAQVCELPRDIPNEQTLPIAQHPSMAAVRWPLNRSEFR
ncbi:hypothetical protein GCM10017691_23870 [Pseudonocardia petroleophila]|uniref:Uncharacterized protein n=1 Tax=Pseudonocardia petroleophila TaxID=37331 RepID=A0A7G7MFV6_9PSEU|nr:hypothetical protein [Pseudonocardia petroleophila]QNG51667.1 hypothetical protein H6H00_26765 [Pseudonocardia petroleophila]